MENIEDSIKIYQLKISLVGISPSIWRRVLLRSDSTIMDLHYVIQFLMGWTDQHLNRFVIYGKEYGVYHSGGLMFQDDPEKICLDQFNFRLKERFQYEYNFYDSWMHEIRLEKIIDYIPSKTYPVCISGSGGTPPEDCGGTWAFMELKQNYSQLDLKSRLIDIAYGFVEVTPEIIDELKFWINIYYFDRSAVNQKLSHYSEYGLNPEHWSEELELCV